MLPPKLHKSILIGENLFLNSGFSLGFYASFASKNIDGGPVPSAYLGLDSSKS